MAIYRCKSCGGDLDIREGASVVECEYCGNKQTVPKVTDENAQTLFNRANLLRLKGEFDKAEKIYEKILELNDTEAEAYWGMILCKFGIEYVEDPATLKRIPTCHRTSYDSIVADEYYKNAIKYADAVQRPVYEAEARVIDEIQKGILAISSQEKPYDVFICYKETDAEGKRTQDSVIANEIYYQLKDAGFKVFYAAITLEDKLGSAFEPIIFAALNSAKVMLAVGTRPEYFTAVWVRNEWSRYLKMMKNDRSKMLIPCYRDMDAYELPEEFAHLQAQDMSKIGFINDLVRGIKKVVKREEPKGQSTPVATPAPSVANNNPTINSLLDRVFLFLEDGKWEDADAYCEKVLDIDAKNARAYLGKLMAELEVRRQEYLGNCRERFDNSENYKKIIRFGDDELKSELAGYIQNIKKRIEQEQIEALYVQTMKAMQNAETEGQYRAAALVFKKLGDYKDSKDLVAECEEMIEELKAEAEYERKRFERLEEAARMEAERQAKRRKKLLIIAASVIGTIVVFVVLLFTLIIPGINYSNAKGLMEEGKWADAIVAFEALDGYMDSEDKIVECKTAILDEQYNNAVALMEQGKYNEAIEALEALDGYKDSDNKIESCFEKINEAIYNNAVALMEQGKYNEAIKALEALDGYKDSEDKIAECKTAILDEQYNNAVALMEAGKYMGARLIFQALGDYRDSAQKAEACTAAMLEIEYHKAISLLDAQNLAEGYRALLALGDYKDCAQRRKAIENDLDTATMAYIKQGNYRQAVELLNEYGYFSAYKSACEAAVEQDYQALVDAGITNITILNGASTVKEFAFKNWDNLTGVIIPNSVSKIEGYAFRECDGLQTVIIGDGVTQIGVYAFYDSTITSIVIGENVKTIEAHAFAYCSSLSRVYYKGTESEWNAISVSSYGNKEFKAVARYYYSETQPTTSGNYWHYVDGVPTAW